VSEHASYRGDPKQEFSSYSRDFNYYLNLSKCHEMVVVKHYFNLSGNLIIFKIGNLGSDKLDQQQLNESRIS